MHSLLVDDKELQLVTLDFETFYGTGYSLTSLSTTDYVHDPRFKVQGVGIKVGDGNTTWFPARKVRKALRGISWSTSALTAHNTLFDGYILSAIYGHRPAFYTDTLSMARAALGHHSVLRLDTVGQALACGSKIQGELAKTKDVRVLSKEASDALGVYCCNDVDVCSKIFDKLYHHISDDELKLIDITLRMFCDPVLEIDEERVQREKDKIVAQRAWRIAKVNATAGELRSRDKFAKLIVEAGGRPPRKMSKATGQSTFAFSRTDEGFKSLLRSDNETVRNLAEAKIAVSSTGSEGKAQRFLDISKASKKLPVYLLYSGAHTHRWSGGNKMNMQNLERGSELRKSILAPPGYVVVVADSAQIEARVLAYLADETSLLDAFRTGRDIYSEFASFIYRRKIDRKRVELDSAGSPTYPEFAEGFVGKTCILGLGYGMGPDRLHDTLLLGVNGPEVDLPRAECQKAINHYRSTYYKIPMLWKQMDFLLLCMASGTEGTFKAITYGRHFIRLPSGLFLLYPNLHADELSNYSYSGRRGPTKIYGGLLTENAVQALARQIIAEQMLEIAKRYRIVMTTHDEIVYLAPESEAQEAFDFGLKVMATAPEWCKDLPLKAEGGWARNYSK